MWGNYNCLLYFPGNFIYRSHHKTKASLHCPRRYLRNPLMALKPFLFLHKIVEWSGALYHQLEVGEWPELKSYNNI